ncbi:hypothetical protein DXN04_30735 [Chitinophaga silvisoli]|uniref:Uncharacterized protein n=2 Tax=Chitinophaga silvisoli TaxID=2291814 RepID=A0A3E1NTH7_9BACT|nr:hypothetical protein DXN04_30735 [Chitinophaga silvisoli]
MLLMSFNAYGQKISYNMKDINNLSFKYWDSNNDIAWRLGVKGDFTYYYYKNNDRIQFEVEDYVIANCAYAIKSDTLIKMFLPIVMEEYKILKLNDDSMILKSLSRSDTVVFFKSKDQEKPIKRLPLGKY